MDMEKLEVAATGGFMGLIGGLAGALGRALLPLRAKATVEPNPLDVRMREEFVTRKEYREDISRMLELMRENEKSFSDIRAGFSQQMGSIEGMLNTMLGIMREDRKR